MEPERIEMRTARVSHGLPVTISQMVSRPYGYKFAVRLVSWGKKLDKLILLFLFKVLYCMISYNSAGCVMRDWSAEILVSATSRTCRGMSKFWENLRQFSAAGRRRRKISILGT